MRVPIEGEAGIGYVLRPGYDLPPLMFTAEEVEAIVVGLALLGRTGDKGLETAAESVTRKIADVLPDPIGKAIDDAPLFASNWHAIPDAGIDLELVRRAIRHEEMLQIVYEDLSGIRTVRDVKPVALVYYVESVVLAAWCGLRGDFRHFRLDRIAECVTLGNRFANEGATLLRRWRELHRLP